MTMNGNRRILHVRSPLCKHRPDSQVRVPGWTWPLRTRPESQAHRNGSEAERIWLGKVTSRRVQVGCATSRRSRRIWSMDAELRPRNRTHRRSPPPKFKSAVTSRVS